MTIFKSGMSMMLSKYSFMLQLYISDGSIFNFMLRLSVSVVCRNCHSLDFPFQCFLLYFVEFISPPVLLCTPVCHLFICVFKSFPPSDGSSVFPVLLVCLCLLLVCQLLFLHTLWFVLSFVFLIFSWILFRLPFRCLTFFIFGHQITLFKARLLFSPVCLGCFCIWFLFCQTGTYIASIYSRSWFETA